MADTSTVTIDLDVLTKYNELVKESLGGDSVYIRAKETVEALVADGSLDDAQKATVISEVIGGAVNGITSSAMSTALQWSMQEKELALKKLEMDQQLNILAQEIVLKEAQTDQIDAQNRLAQVESRRMYGIATFDVNGNITSLTDSGKVWEDVLLIRQNATNAVTEGTLVETKIVESKAVAHKIVADAYVNFGSYTFVVDPGTDGLASVTQTHVGGHVTLSDTQQVIAVEQGKGYTYNAWANALTGSASMLGTAIASGDFSFNVGSNEAKLFDAVVLAAESLQGASSDDAGAIPNV